MGRWAAPYAELVDVKTTSATISDLVNDATYTFAVTAYNTSGNESEYSEPISDTMGLLESRFLRAVLANISSRTFVQTGEDVMIGGFIIDGIVAKRVALRAVGPSLASAGVSGALADPVLQIMDSTGSVVATNDNWNILGEEVSAIGLAPGDAREAALVITLAPGAYTAIVSGKAATSGVALFELYDLDVATGRGGEYFNPQPGGLGRQCDDRRFHYRRHNGHSDHRAGDWSVSDRRGGRRRAARSHPRGLR